AVHVLWSNSILRTDPTVTSETLTSELGTKLTAFSIVTVTLRSSPPPPLVSGRDRELTPVNSQPPATRTVTSTRARVASVRVRDIMGYLRRGRRAVRPGHWPMTGHRVRVRTRTS